MRAALTAEVHGQPWPSDIHEYDSIFGEYMSELLVLLQRKRAVLQPFAHEKSKKETEENVRVAILLTLIHVAFSVFLKPGLPSSPFIIEIMSL